MAGPAPVVEKPKLGRGATIAGLIFALLVLTGFSAGTAMSYRDSVSESHYDDHGEESGDKEHADEEQAEDDHSDEESGDDDHADE